MKTLAGQEVLRFELPISANLPPLRLPQLGLSQHSVSGSGVGNDYSMTIMDAPDQRLLAWGITVGFSDVLRRWVLRAPRWVPVLPNDAFFDGSPDKPPIELRQYLRPFLRDAELIAVTTRNVTQRVSALMNPVGNQLGEVIDRTIDVVLHGESALQYRELLVTSAALAPAQIAQLRESIIDAGGVEVDQFPTLGNRLGVADYPPLPQPFTPQMTTNDFVAARLIRRWTQLAAAAVSSGEDVVEALTAIGRDLDGLSWAFKKSAVATWRKLVSDGLAEPNSSTCLPLLAAFDQTLSHLDIDGGANPITDRLTTEMSEALDAVLETACTVEVSSANPKWHQAQLAVDRAVNIARIAKPIYGSRARKLARRLNEYSESLVGCCVDESEDPDLTNMTVAQAFEAGKRYQQLVNAMTISRAKFLSTWMKQWQSVKQAEIK